MDTLQSLIVSVLDILALISQDKANKMSDKVILLVNSLGNGGAERVVSILMDSFTQQGRNVSLVCLEHNDFYRLPEGLEVTYLSQFTGQEAGWKKLLYLPIFAWRLKKIIKQQEIKLVQSHVYRANYVNVLAKLCGATHLAQLVNVGQISLYQQEGMIGKINLALIRWLYPKADLLILKSHGMQYDLEKLMPTLSCKQVVIHNPYDIEKIQQQALVEPIGWQKTEDKFTLVSVGRLIELKRVEDIIRALSKLPEQVELVLVGEGNYKDYLKGLAKAQGVDERVIFVGRQENPFSYVSRADAFVMASRSEGFPNVLAEALVCGIPCIAGDCTSGPREILAPESLQSHQMQVGDGVEWASIGALVAVGDVNAFAEAIQTLMETPELRSRYQQAGRKRSIDFKRETIVAEYAREMWE
jgi:N-acetylgalactosamine-N,N'-diacetylbacillosaminyl-diphospho-undecaprenol 4-alpha-N-acetylgalactosaminyltransferase